MALQFNRRVRLEYGDPNLILEPDLIRFEDLEKPRGIIKGALAPQFPFVVDSFAGDSHRIKFKGSRTNQYIPDKCTIEIFNLPGDVRRGLKSDLESQWVARRDIQQNHFRSRVSTLQQTRVDLTQDEKNQSDRDLALKLKEVSDAFQVRLYVAYGNDTPELLFIGDLMDVLPETKVGVDTITRLELGDTLLALRDGYLRQVFGPNSSLETILKSVMAVAAIEIDDLTEKNISILSANAVITKVDNGFYLAGRIANNISEVLELFGMQWWVTEGKLKLAAQGGTLNDFSIFLPEQSLIEFKTETGYNDVAGRTLLNPRLVPGRGIRMVTTTELQVVMFQGLLSERTFPFIDEQEIIARINKTTFVGDTHGTPFWVDFEASSTNTLLAPAIEFNSGEFTTAEREAAKLNN